MKASIRDASELGDEPPIVINAPKESL